MSIGNSIYHQCATNFAAEFFDEFVKFAVRPEVAKINCLS